jgi:hypothetical protein
VGIVPRGVVYVDVVIVDAELVATKPARRVHDSFRAWEERAIMRR